MSSAYSGVGLWDESPAVVDLRLLIKDQEYMALITPCPAHYEN